MTTQIDTRYELIEACQRGDRSAQRTLYEDYSHAMYNVCCRMMGDQEEAQDVLQCAFVKIFRKLDQYNHQSTPGAWIKRIVINECINHLRTRQTQLVELQDYDAPVEDVEIPDEWLSVGAIRAAIDALPDGYRRVVTLYLIEGYDHAEIAQILDITVTTSKTQYHRAKKKLRESLKAISKAC